MPKLFAFNISWIAEKKYVSLFVFFFSSKTYIYEKPLQIFL